MNTVSMSNTVYDFVEGSAQRHALFQHIQGDGAKNLKHLCETRWGDRTHAFKDFVQTFDSVILFLKFTQEDDATDAGAKATGILSKIQKFKFFFLLNYLK